MYGKTMSLDRDRETALWGWLRDSLQSITVPKHIQRIEDSTKSGTPDVEGCIEGRNFWIELKVAYEQVRSPVVRVKTTDKQVYFAYRRTKVGGLSWYLIRVGKHPHRSHYLIHGSLAEQLFDKPITLDWLHENSAVAPNCTAAQALLRASQPK
jgi:hypothetical protein